MLAPAATQAMLASHHLPMVKYGWILTVVVEMGGGLAILFGLFTRPVGLVLATPPAQAGRNPKSRPQFSESWARHLMLRD